MTVELGIGLPTVDDPRLNLQLVGREPLNPHAVEEPRCVRGNKRGLVRPVVVVVITEETYIRHEDSRVDVKPMVRVEVVPAPRFREVFVSMVEVPLADPCAAVI